jgi:hypothetical protein
MGAESLREPLAGKVLFLEKMNVREGVFSLRLLLFYAVRFFISAKLWVLVAEIPQSRDKNYKIFKCLFNF